MTDNVNISTVKWQGVTYTDEQGTSAMIPRMILKFEVDDAAQALTLRHVLQSAAHADAMDIEAKDNAVSVTLSQRAEPQVSEKDLAVRLDSLLEILESRDHLSQEDAAHLRAKLSKPVKVEWRKRIVLPTDKPAGFEWGRS